MLGDLWVSTRGHDYGVEVQRAAIASEAERIADHVGTGKNADRLGLIHALARPDPGALIASKLDRLSRLVGDVCGILRAETQLRRGRKPRDSIALDGGIDIAIPMGRMVAHILIAVAEWEESTITEKKSAVLAAREAGSWQDTDPASLVPSHVVQVSQRARSHALTLRAVAASFNSAEIPSKQEEVWQVPSVQRAFYTADSETRSLQSYMTNV